MERPEPRGEREATLLWLSVPWVEKRGLAARGLLGWRPGGPDDVEGPCMLCEIYIFPCML